MPQGIFLASSPLPEINNNDDDEEEEEEVQEPSPIPPKQKSTI